MMALCTLPSPALHTHTHTHTLKYSCSLFSSSLSPSFSLYSHTPLLFQLPLLWELKNNIDDEWEEPQSLCESDGSSGNPLPSSPRIPHWLVWWMSFSQSVFYTDWSMSILFLFFSGEKSNTANSLCGHFSCQIVVKPSELVFPLESAKTFLQQYSPFEVGILNWTSLNTCRQENMLFVWHSCQQDVVICQCLSKALINDNYKTFFWPWLTEVRFG